MKNPFNYFIEPDYINPWKRKRERKKVPYHGSAHVVFKGRPVHTSKAIFKPSPIDLYSKRAVLKVSPSVVTLISYSGGNQVFWGSGVIFGSFWKDNSLYYSVLTSATLLSPPPCYRYVPHRFIKNHSSKSTSARQGKGYDNVSGHFVLDHSSESTSATLPGRKDKIILDSCCKEREDGGLPIDDKIDVYLKGGNLCEGTVLAYDFHYNIAVLTFKSDSRLPCAVLRPLDDSLALNNAPTDAQGFACRFPCLPLKLIPGDVVTAVGRSARKPFGIMAASGKYSSVGFDEISNSNCMELLHANCKITKCGIGGPLISRTGEVIGITFCSVDCTPFLPINVFLKWWSHHNATRTLCRPSLGMKVANLQTADLGISDQVQKLGISQGLIVEKVLSGSPAETCGLRPGDVVFKCSDTTVVSPLQFFETVWDMAGKVVDIVVVRGGSCERMNIEVKDITSADEFYQWLLPRARLDFKWPS